MSILNLSRRNMLAAFCRYLDSAPLDGQVAFLHFGVTHQNLIDGFEIETMLRDRQPGADLEADYRISEAQVAEMLQAMRDIYNDRIYTASEVKDALGRIVDTSIDQVDRALGADMEQDEEQKWQRFHVSQLGKLLTMACRVYTMAVRTNRPELPQALWDTGIKFDEELTRQLFNEKEGNGESSEHDR